MNPRSDLDPLRGPSLDWLEDDPDHVPHKCDLCNEPAYADGYLCQNCHRLEQGLDDAI